MEVNILLVILTFVIMIAVILLADSLTTAMLIVSLLANFLVISAQFGKIHKKVTTGSVGPAATTLQSNMIPDGTDQVQQSELFVEKALPYEDQETNIYGPFYDMWHSYQDTYTSAYDTPQIQVGVSAAECNYNVDEANAIMAQRRARDKKCSDGWVTKDANYYKHHYGSELSESEDKQWWGRHEW